MIIIINYIFCRRPLIIASITKRWGQNMRLRSHGHSLNVNDGSASSVGWGLEWRNHMRWDNASHCDAIALEIIEQSHAYHVNHIHIQCEKHCNCAQFESAYCLILIDHDWRSTRRKPPKRPWHKRKSSTETTWDRRSQRVHNALNKGEGEETEASACGSAQRNFIHRNQMVHLSCTSLAVAMKSPVYSQSDCSSNRCITNETMRDTNFTLRQRMLTSEKQKIGKQKAMI